MSLRWNLTVLAGAAGAFAVVAIVVVMGGLTGLDQYAVDHWMPQVQAGNASSSALGSIQYYPKLGSALHTFCNVWTYPASPVLSSLLGLGGAAALVRRDRRAAAVAWGVAWIVANAVELLGKSVLERPGLHLGPAPLDNFHSSFPSGHTARAVLLTAMFATIWRRAVVPMLAWLVVTLPALVVNADHTPSDVLGGVLLAVTALFAVRAWLARAAPVRLAYATAASR